MFILPCAQAASHKNQKQLNHQTKLKDLKRSESMELPQKPQPMMIPKLHKIDCLEIKSDKRERGKQDHLLVTLPVIASWHVGKDVLQVVETK